MNHSNSCAELRPKIPNERYHICCSCFCPHVVFYSFSKVLVTAKHFFDLISILFGAKVCEMCQSMWIPCG